MTKLFDELAYRYRFRTSGFTRFYRIGQRKGDGAHMAVIELVDRPGELRKARPCNEDTFLKSMEKVLPPIPVYRINRNKLRRNLFMKKILLDMKENKLNKLGLAGIESGNEPPKELGSNTNVRNE